jgi:predicted enzyme related to lactoylglutathione lyase
MSDKKYSIGTIISADITTPNAPELRDFYQQVIGWQSEEMNLKDENGEYSDYIMKDVDGNWVGGVCYKRGDNKDFPPQWIVYVNVEDVSKSVEKCKELGGKILKEQKNDDGVYSYALIEDPVGAILALTKV